MSYFILSEQETGAEFIVEARSMSLQDFHDALQGRVIIKFVKKGNNRIRYIYGTRNKDMAPANQRSKWPGPDSEGYKGPPEVIPIFDLVKNDWRSFDVRTVKDLKKRKLNFIDKIFRRNRYKKDFDQKKKGGKEKVYYEESVGAMIFYALELNETETLSFSEYLVENI